MVDLVYKACTKDNLILSCGFEAALYTVNILDFLFVSSLSTRRSLVAQCSALRMLSLLPTFSNIFWATSFSLAMIFLLDNPIKKGVDVFV